MGSAHHTREATAAPSEPRRGSDPAAKPPAVARLLALQRSAGNAAVNRLLRIPLDQPRVTSPPEARVRGNGRQRFEAQLRDRWGVANVRTGTEAHQIDQMRRSTPDADPSPTSISGWQEWDPGPDNELYDDILDAFEVMGFVLGGVPEVNELRFLASDYENVRGTAQARPRHGATYGGGLLNIFQPTETMTWRLPQGRSTPGAPAAVVAGSSSDSRRRVIVHELAHGVFERFGSPMLGGDTQFFQDWAQAAGWTSRGLVQNGTVVTDANWNDAWPEQPVSAYATTNNMEDFAESLMCFIEAPGVLSARSPARHQFIQARLGAWRGGLRRPRAMTAPLPRRPPTGDFPVPSGDGRPA
ncbi:MAG TPA: hypothetical protein VEX67_02975 [Solirubrobacteraceae bacterium]|nr:hypothetical protein [Solirubrobacteraceae bacterium]